MTLLARLRALAPADRCLLVQAALLLAVVRVGLAVLPFRRVCRMVALVTSLQLSKSPNSGERVALAVHRASRCVPSTCLTRALAAQALLQMQGEPAALAIGVRRGADGRLNAHASVAHGSRIIVGRTTGAYTQLACFVRLH